MSLINVNNYQVDISHIGATNTGNIIDNNQSQNYSPNTSNEITINQENNALLVDEQKSNIDISKSNFTEKNLSNFVSCSRSNGLYYMDNSQNSEISKKNIFSSLNINNYDSLFKKIEKEQTDYDFDIRFDKTIPIISLIYKESDLKNRKLEIEYNFEDEIINENYSCKFVKINDEIDGIKKYLQYDDNLSLYKIEDKKIKFSLQLTKEKQYNEFIFALALFKNGNIRIINSYIIFSVKITENENEKE